MGSTAGEHGEHFEGPVTVEVLADLRAGLLDDRTAAGLRRRARTDPGVAHDLAALDRVRRAVARLAVDADSAAEVPPEVAARIGAALRAQPAPADRPPRGRTVAGVGALTVVAVAVLLQRLRHRSPQQVGAVQRT